jgi:hypothetical protein
MTQTNMHERIGVGLKRNGNRRKHHLSFSFPPILSESKTKSETLETNMETEITGDECGANTGQVQYEKRMFFTTQGRCNTLIWPRRGLHAAVWPHTAAQNCLHTQLYWDDYD